MAYITNNWLKANPERRTGYEPRKVKIKGYQRNWEDCIYHLEFFYEEEMLDGSIKSEYKIVNLAQDDIELILPDLLISASDKSRIDILKSIIPNVDISDELKLELISLLSKKQ